jgi:hypothetical protein
VEIAAPPRRCRSCGALLASTSRPDRRYCSASCRVTAYRQREAEPGMTASELDRLVAMLDAPKAEVALVAGISVAAAGSWQAAAWLLERQHPERWGNLAERPPALAADDSDDPDRDWPPDVA